MRKSKRFAKFEAILKAHRDNYPRAVVECYENGRRVYDAPRLPFAQFFEWDKRMGQHKILSIHYPIYWSAMRKFRCAVEIGVGLQDLAPAASDPYPCYGGDA